MGENVFQTKRCLVRRFRYSDLQDVFFYSSNPKIGPMAGWRPHSSIEETYQTLRTFISSDELWAIVDKSTNCVIGSIGVHREPSQEDSQVRMIGYVLSEPYWGKGIMVEVVSAMICYVFTKTNIELLTIRHYSFNYQSKRVIEKCGFHFDGIVTKGSRLINGEMCDDYRYSLRKEDYLRNLRKI